MLLYLSSDFLIGKKLVTFFFFFFRKASCDCQAAHLKWPLTCKTDSSSGFYSLVLTVPATRHYQVCGRGACRTESGGISTPPTQCRTWSPRWVPSPCPKPRSAGKVGTCFLSSSDCSFLTPLFFLDSFCCFFLCSLCQGLCDLIGDVAVLFLVSVCLLFPVAVLHYSLVPLILSAFSALHLLFKM